MRFVIAQNFIVKLNIIFQDNTRTMKLVENSKASSTKRSRYFNIKMFCIEIVITSDLVNIKCYPTKIMRADYMKKLQTRAKFKDFRDYVLNLLDRILLMVMRSILANE